jgi:hypothetical protein
MRASRLINNNSRSNMPRALESAPTRRSLMFTHIRKKILFLSLLLFTSRLMASTLETPSFVITIEIHCKEGEVTCDRVTYHGVSKKSGKSISLKGKTKHSIGKDGSPSQFQGYEFQSDRTHYWVGQDGLLEVIRGEKVLVSEKGNWKR